MNSLMAKVFLGAARAYTTRFPDGKGVSRLTRMVESKAIPALPDDAKVTVRTADGRRFTENVHEAWFLKLMMLARRDPAETCVVNALVKRGDTVLDVGANYGWYTTLMSKLVGSSGQVHAFEAAPTTMALLQRNCRENGVGREVTLNNVALGSAPGTVTIHVPKQHGGASLKPYYDEPVAKHDVPMITLDSYLADKKVSGIKLAKMDVEGSELAILKGASTLLKSDSPPVWLMEVSRVASGPFGYTPEELTAYLADHGYEVFQVLEMPRGRLTPLADVSKCQDADNVLYVPRKSRAMVTSLLV